MEGTPVPGNVTPLLSPLPSLSSSGLPDLVHPCLLLCSRFLLVSRDSAQLKHTDLAFLYTLEAGFFVPYRPLLVMFPLTWNVLLPHSGLHGEVPDSPTEDTSPSLSCIMFFIVLTTQRV